MNTLNQKTLAQTLEACSKLPFAANLAQLGQVFTVIYDGIESIKETAWNEGYEQALLDEGVFAAEEAALADRVVDAMYTHVTDENGFGGQAEDPSSGTPPAYCPERIDRADQGTDDWYFQNQHDVVYPAYVARTTYEKRSEK